jgi:hypothetical protein
MIAEANQRYRGVLCLRCGQPIPLSFFAARKECGFEEQEACGRDEFTGRSFTLRCRVCDGEGLDTVLDVIDCDGTPRVRSSQVRKHLLICPI